MAMKEKDSCIKKVFMNTQRWSSIKARMEGEQTGATKYCSTYIAPIEEPCFLCLYMSPLRGLVYVMFPEPRQAGSTLHTHKLDGRSSLSFPTIYSLFFITHFQSTITTLCIVMTDEKHNFKTEVYA